MQKEQDPIDIYIGHMIRRIRSAYGWNLRELSGALGVSYQQIQKYETGQNRISAAQLLRVAHILSFPIQAFFPSDPNNADILPTPPAKHPKRKAKTCQTKKTKTNRK